MLHRAARLEFGVPDWFDEVEKDPAARGIHNSDHDAGLDHYRHFGPVAFLQPYDAQGEQLAVLLDVCAKRGLKVVFNGASYYYPGRTFSIAIFRPEDEQQFRRYRWCDEDLNVDIPEGE
jgi:hypothetical protein